MSPRSLKRLGAVFVLLAAAWGAMVAVERLSPRAEVLWAEAPQAQRLELSSGAGKVVLARSGADPWRLEQPFAFPADERAVGDLLAKLAKAELSEALSEDESRHALFQVDEASSVVLRGFLDPAAPPALDVRVGRQGADFDTVFVLRAGAKAVREARGLARYELDREPGGWADKQVFSVSPDQVTSIELRGPRSGLKVLRSGEGWELEGGRRLSSATVAAKVEPVLAALARLEADGVLPEAGVRPSALEGLKNPELRVVVRRAGLEAPALELAVGPRDPELMHPARRAGTEGVLFRFSQWRLDPFRELLKLKS